MGVHSQVRGSRFHDFHCFTCKKFSGYGYTYDNGQIPEGYKGGLFLWKEDGNHVVTRKHYKEIKQ